MSGYPNGYSWLRRFSVVDSIFDLDLDPNPNDVDFCDYDCDGAASENLILTAHIPVTPQEGYPAGFDIAVSDTVDIPVPTTGYPSSSCKIYYPEGDGHLRTCGPQRKKGAYPWPAK